jgi:UPF0176 protein
VLAAMNQPKLSVNVNLPQTLAAFKVVALYKFADLPDCAALQPKLAAFCCARKIRGTIILAPEGINGTVAGSPEAIDALVQFLLADPLFAGRLAGAEIKFSIAEAMPFLRMKVRLKDEIVTLRAPQANPAKQVGTYVDTRNDYEARLGSFAGALDPGTKSFTEFKEFVAESLDPARDKKVAMFCTGGIRCEKASSYLLSQGFEEVFHLKGGILKYLEIVPPEQSTWQGECFVFDERVSVAHGLAEGDATLCRACREPLTAKDRAHPDYLEGVRCGYCANDTEKHAAAAERQRQMELASARGETHIGENASASAERNREARRLLREASRKQQPPSS